MKGGERTFAALCIEVCYVDQAATYVFELYGGSSYSADFGLAKNSISLQSEVMQISLMRQQTGNHTK
jgi:hypothetical protein